jgi:hypothetical protein
MKHEEHQGHEEDRRAERGRMVVKCKVLPELFQVVIECRDEAEQRELWERMKGEGRRVRLLVI